MSKEIKCQKKKMSYPKFNHIKLCQIYVVSPNSTIARAYCCTT